MKIGIILKTIITLLLFATIVMSILFNSCSEKITQPDPDPISKLSNIYGTIKGDGILVYSDSKKKFNIPFNDKYHSMLLSTIEQMHYQLHTNMITRNHDNIMKCYHCSMSVHCPERIKK